MIRKWGTALIWALCIALSSPTAGFAATLLPNGEQTFVDSNGAPLASGQACFYIPGTLTAKQTWSDALETTANTSPCVTLDTSGRAIIYGTGQYREILKDSTGATVWDQLTQDSPTLTPMYYGGTSTGTANAQTITLSGAMQPQALAAGQLYTFIPGLSNTGAATLVVATSQSTFTAAAIKKPTASGLVALAGGELQPNQPLTVIYDGTAFDIQSAQYAASTADYLTGPTTPVSPDVALWGATSTSLVDGGRLIPGISGLLPTAISGTSTTAAVTISAGEATDSTDSIGLYTTTGFSWAVANGNAINGYAGGSTLPDSSTINFYMCSGGSGTGSYASTTFGLAAASCPPGFQTYIRRIFSLWTDASGNLLGSTPWAATEEGGGAVEFTQQEQGDVGGVAPTTTRTLYTLSVPKGLVVKALFRATLSSASNNPAIIFQSPAEADVVPGPGAPASLTAVTATAGNQASGEFEKLTNTSGQIAARASTTSATLSIYTFGWIDFRRN